MKKHLLLVAILFAMAAWSHFHHQSFAAEQGAAQTEEYLTIRWGGRGNTHLIRPDGKVESLGAVMTKIPKPNGSDERSFYMSIAMNAVAKEGFEFAGMTNEEIVMKRRVTTQ